MNNYYFNIKLIIIMNLLLKSNEKLNSGEKGLWDITHIKGPKVKNTKKNFATNSGEGGTWNIKNIKR